MRLEGKGWFAVLLAAACCGCSGTDAAGKELHYGLTLSPSGIDPHIHASSELGIPLSSVYDTLAFRDADGGFVPGLAEDWEISPDGTEYLFHLRHGVRFHDGTAFDAEAVKVNLDRILAPETKSQKARYLIEPVQAVSVLDAYTVRLELAEPYAPLLDALSQVYTGMASPAALKEWGADYQFHQVGTGPFRFVEYTAGDHLTLERNPDYAWAPGIYRNPTAQVDRIVFRFYADPAARTPALLSGEADVMGEVLPGDAAMLEEGGAFTVVPADIPGQPLQFFFNLRQSPTDDPLVRRALLESADRAALVSTVFGAYSSAAAGPLTAATWGAADVIGQNTFGRRDAEDLLQQAGWSDSDGDGLRDNAGRKLSLTVVYPPWGLTPQVAELLEMQWREIGADVDLVQAASFSALKEAQAGGAYHLISWNQAGTDPDLLRSFYHSGGAYNWSGIEDAGLDMLLDSAVQAGNAAQRLDLYRQAQEVIARECAVLPIREVVNLNVAAARVKGLRFSPHGWFPVLIDVELA